MVSYCNKFFTTIGKNMAEKIEKLANPIKMNYNNINSMYLKPVDENEIIRHIHSLKNNCAPGEDGISALLIKHIHKHVLKPLTYLLNLIFKTGIVPEYFKTSVITPIFKSGNKKQITNYRPISVINNFSKILEKALKERLVKFFEINNILSHRQFGFIESMSTNDALYEIISEITNNLNDSKKALAVFLDLAKAFDTVPHHNLLEILSGYGIRGPVLDVFKSYLSNRVQSVKIDGVISEPRTVAMGIPQGTVLGPILFITYINPLLKEMHIEGSMLSYADDTVLVFSGDSWNNVKNMAENGIRLVKNWFDSFQLSLNLTKTNFIAFSPTEKNRPYFNELKINDTFIQGTKHTKYLGIIIDCHLRWSFHIERITLCVKRLLHKFYVLREFMSKKLLICIYKSLIESIFRYGIIVWGGMYKTLLQPLNTLQNYILKIIFKKPKLYHTSLLYSVDVLNIRCLYILSVNKFMNRLNNLSIKHSVNTRCRQMGNLSMPYNKKTLCLKSIVYLGPKLHNILPLQIRQLKANKKFNRKCTEYIYNNYDSIYDRLF